MDDSLHIIRALYADDEASAASDRDAFQARLDEDETLRAEFEELQAVKAVLDRRPSSRPSAHVVDDIVAAAGRAARGEPVDAVDTSRSAGARAAEERAALNGAPVSPSRASAPPSSDRRRAERPPQSPDERSRSSRRVDLRKLGAGLAALLIVVVGVWQLAPSTSLPDDPATTAQADASASASSAAPSSRADRSTRRSLPDWDEGDDVVRLQRRLELIRARSPATQWSGFQPASQTVSP